LLASASNSETIQSFYHGNFRRGRLDLLGGVTRRGASKGERDAKTLQNEIASLKRRETEHREKARELEEQNRRLILENSSLIEENKRLKTNWNSVRDALGRNQSVMRQPPPPQGYSQIADGQVSALFPPYQDHNSAAMFRGVHQQLPLFNPVTQTGSMETQHQQHHPTINPYGYPVEDDFYRSGGPYGQNES
jgi:hypothetical protein